MLSYPLITRLLLSREVYSLRSLSVNEILSGLYETMEEKLHLLTCCDSIDCELRTGENVTADKNVGLCSLISEFISNCCVAAAKLDLAVFKQCAPINGLTDREKNIIRRDCNYVIFIVLR